MAWKLIENNAISNETAPAVKNIHQSMSTRYEKSCNHLCITHQATGKAITLAINTSLTKSFDTSNKILETDAPRTFRTPISFVRCTVENMASPNNPRHATKMATAAKKPKTFPNNCSFWYCRLKLSLRNE